MSNYGRTHDELGKKPAEVTEADVRAMFARLGLSPLISDWQYPLALDDVFSLVEQHRPAMCHWGVSYNAMSGDWSSEFTTQVGSFACYAQTPHLALLWSLDIWLEESCEGGNHDSIRL